MLTPSTCYIEPSPLLYSTKAKAKKGMHKWNAQIPQDEDEGNIIIMNLTMFWNT